MNELIDAIKAWPVIVQGALGSALFWLILVVGERARRMAADRYSHYSKHSRLNWLIDEQTRLETVTAVSLQEQGIQINFLLYRASRPLLKSCMWLIYGLAMETMFSPSGLVGYVVCLSYLFKAYAVVGPINMDGDIQSRLAEIKAEIESLEKASQVNSSK